MDSHLNAWFQVVPRKEPTESKEGSADGQKSNRSNRSTRQVNVWDVLESNPDPTSEETKPASDMKMRGRRRGMDAIWEKLDS